MARRLFNPPAHQTAMRQALAITAVLCSLIVLSTSFSQDTKRTKLASYDASALTDLNASALATGTVTVSRGGTGLNSITAYGLLAGGTTPTGALQSLGLGTTGQVLTSAGADALPSWSSTSQAIDFKAYESAGGYTWTKPSNARLCYVWVIGGGGGGGSGNSRAAALNASGGGGGAPGGYLRLEILAATVGSTVTVTVGAAGTGGAAVSGTTGNDGASGGTSRFGNFKALGGDRGRGGTAGVAGLGGASSAASMGGPHVFYATASGANGAINNSTAGTPTILTTWGPTAGGGGAGLNTSDYPGNAGAGGTISGANVLYATPQAAAGGWSGNQPTDGQAATGLTDGLPFGLGGGGATCYSGYNGGSGGAGSRGGGGGGGGGARQPQSSGAGGHGGSGAVYVLTLLAP